MRPARTILLSAALTAAAFGTTPAPARAAPRLTVFGDSYSIPARERIPNWPTLLHDQGVVGGVNDFAEYGATALTRRTRCLADEVRKWRHAGRPLGLTVVYLGFNDIGGDMAGARTGYQAGIDALVAAGATSGGNRLFLVQPHDVGSTPLYNRTAERGPLRQGTEDWDAFVAYTAHHVGATAVDVFSAIDRVLQRPAAYGFDNVTTADHAASATTALYDDEFHVGGHGQAIIARTIAYRLRRGAVLAASDGEVWPPAPSAVPAALPVAWAAGSWPAAVPALLAAAFGSGDEPGGAGRDGSAWPH
jgi:phospholipase/lecithinase/hemolysin